MKYLLIGLAFMSFFGSLHANQMSKIKVFPVAAQFEYSNGQPSTLIQTSQIISDDGRLARGPHTVIFTLADDAQYPVVINGQTINPSESIEFTINLSLTDHKITMPFYPAVDNVIGVANYDLHIPKLRSVVCSSGFFESEEDCYKVDIKNVTYVCSVNYQYDPNSKQCMQYEELAAEKYCDVGMFQEGDECFERRSDPTLKTCDEGDFWSFNSGTSLCQYQEVKVFEQCAVGEHLLDGSCYTIVDRIDVCPSGYTDHNATQCKSNTSRQPLKTCPAGAQLSGSKCYTYTYVGYGRATCGGGGRGERATVGPNDCYWTSRDDPSIGHQGFYYVRCPSGSSNIYNDKRCFSTTQTEASNAGCQSGYTSIGNVCHVLSAKNLDICPTNSADLDEASCYSNNVNCPVNFNENGDKLCEQYYTQAYTPTCPDGPYTLESESCNFELEHSPNHRCNEGTPKSSNNEMCDIVRVEQVTLECLSGYDIDADAEKCRDEQRVPFLVF
jgi:hypothetical protein